MIQVDHLSRSYGNFLAIHDVSFDIEKGQIVGLLGKNGAGKTTIMNLLTGLLEPDSGIIHFDGLSLTDCLSRYHSFLGYLPENLPLYDDMRVLDYLQYVAFLKKIHINQQTFEVSRVLELTGLTHCVYKRIDQLSRGYRQRVGVAQAILGSPKMLILDEPTNGLDPEQTLQMRQLIQSISQHATVILSTHIMQEVRALCERVLVIKEGKLVIDEFLSNLNKSNTFLIRCSLEQETLNALLKENLGHKFVDLQLIKRDNGACVYHVGYALKDSGVSRDELANQLIACVVGYDKSSLFGLNPFERDLESIFNSSNSS